MTTYDSDLLQLLNERGYVHQMTDAEGLDALAARQTVPGYIGFDATAPSLHVGSLVQIMMLRRLQQTGHKPIVVMGGGTTKIGDPSGKDEARQLLSAGDIVRNMQGIGQVFDRYIDFGDDQAIMVNNADWLDELNYVAFLRDYGRHFTINRMLSFDSVRLRLDREQPLTFLEFNYMLLQAYDFMELNKRYGCALQMGGSDQWGNIVNGIDLARRINGASVYGLTSPLLTKADGSKMGKSAQGAVWLNAAKLASFDFWQFWRNTLDADVGRFLRLYTEIDLEECDRLAALEGAEINEAKIILANAVTTLAHGAEAAQQAAATAQEIFAEGGAGRDLPLVSFTAEEIGAGLSLAQLLLRSGLVKSGKEAKRFLAEGAVRLEDEAVNDAGAMVAAEVLARGVKLSLGKKRHIRVQIG